MTAIHESIGSCDVRRVESADASELYITAVPADGDVSRMYEEIARVLRDSDAAIVEERLFGAADAFPAGLSARAVAYGDLDDGVMPALLIPRTASGRIVGAQVHAISGIGRPRTLGQGGLRTARAFDCNACHYLTGTFLRASAFRDAGDQARGAFEIADDLIRQAGGSLFDLARTWLWMDDVLSWYGDLNRVRNQFFTERGLMSRPGNMPASTGIGVSPAAGKIAIDLFAAWGTPDTVARFHAAGHQRSAYEYGSAFARASRVNTPGGTTIYCSGTAAIDAAGRTCFLDDIPGQVGMTVENVLAVLRDMGCGGEDVVQAMAYCATPQVQQHFLATYREPLNWPCMTMIGDVCRADLLFEIEVTACPNAHRMQ